MIKNQIDQIKTKNIFENFEIKNDEQEKIVEWLKSLAKQMAEVLLSEKWKFNSAKLISIWWKAWRWKTHLQEAFIHEMIIYESEIKSSFLDEILQQQTW